MHMIYLPLAVVILICLVTVVLQLCDLVTTSIIIKTGIGKEANPVMTWLFKVTGAPEEVLAVKGFLVSVGVTVMVSSQIVFWPQIVTLGVITAYYSWVAYNNLKVLRS